MIAELEGVTGWGWRGTTGSALLGRPALRLARLRSNQRGKGRLYISLTQIHGDCQIEWQEISDRFADRQRAVMAVGKTTAILQYLLLTQEPLRVAK